MKERDREITKLIEETESDIKKLLNRLSVLKEEAKEALKKDKDAYSIYTSYYGDKLNRGSLKRQITETRYTLSLLFKELTKW